MYQALGKSPPGVFQQHYCEFQVSRRQNRLRKATNDLLTTLATLSLDLNLSLRSHL
jgi:hypothetical protein